MLLNFLAIRSIYCHFVYFVAFWYIFRSFWYILVCCTKKNLATLYSLRLGHLGLRICSLRCCRLWFKVSELIRHLFSVLSVTIKLQFVRIPTLTFEDGTPINGKCNPAPVGIQWSNSYQGTSLVFLETPQCCVSIFETVASKCRTNFILHTCNSVEIYIHKLTTK
jgi:hypothetical protein